MEKMTWRRSVALTAIVVLTLAAGLPAFAADRAFTLHNHTQQTIKSLTVSPTGTGQWSEDILGQDILDDHTDLVVRFPYDESDCKWDVRVSYRRIDRAGQRRRSLLGRRGNVYSVGTVCSAAEPPNHTVCTLANSWMPNAESSRP